MSKQPNHGVFVKPCATEAEKKELKQLLDLYDRAVLRRARALAILAQRGYDIDVVGAFPASMAPNWTLCRRTTRKLVK